MSMNLVEKHCVSNRAHRGWVRALRKHKDVVFLDVSDGSAAAKVQVVVPANCVRPGLSYGAAVQVLGKLVASAHKGQEFEVHAEDITVLGPCDVKSQGFFHVHTPILTSNDCEGGGNVFTVKPMNQQAAEKESGKSSEELFFGRPAFLTVSAQLHLEAVAMSLSKVYTVGPTFRAENCNTRRHVCEFCMVEAEEAFVTSLDTLLQRTEDVVKKVFTNLVNSSNQDVAVIMRDAPSGHLDTVQAAMEKPFVRMTYSECINVLQSARNEKSSLHNIEWGQDLGADHEEYLVKHCGNGGPLFVIHFPSALKPFYMKHSTHQSSTVEGFDLLAPFGGELCGGSLREDDPTVLEERLQTLGIAEAFPW
ncbi:hypothetical protein HPB50_019969 [Hyalomma asiaticum]|uniref:Uncharacterized protein n=1 Tax=Hyalomma asiaticum TaxID=266040 RepID=A0ACB7SNS0_HYAAI|nr:hypothetical protein HPB50_019969 [Hyalomma asiaticum]